MTDQQFSTATHVSKNVAGINLSTHIEKGQTTGGNCYNHWGKPVRFVVFPGEGMSGSSLSFEGSLDGQDWFLVRGFDGSPFSLRVPPANPLNAVTARRAPNPVPIGNPALLGYPFIRPASPVPEAATREIIFLLGEN